MQRFPVVTRKTSDRDVPVQLARAMVQAGLGPGFHFAGNVTLAARPLRVAVIGSRQAGTNSLAAVEALSVNLASAGATIVSGAAYGTDMVAHRGALAAGGSTIAVLPMAISQGGGERLAGLVSTLRDDQLLLMISPFSTTQGITRSTPVIRNRLIAALADVVVVGEAHASSGTFHCVRAAVDMGLPLFLLRDRALHRDGALEEIHAPLIQKGARSFTIDEAFDPSFPTVVRDVATRAGRDRHEAERSQLSLFGDHD